MNEGVNYHYSNVSWHELEGNINKSQTPLSLLVCDFYMQPCQGKDLIEVTP